MYYLFVSWVLTTTPTKAHNKIIFIALNDHQVKITAYGLYCMYSTSVSRYLTKSVKIYISLLCPDEFIIIDGLV